MEDRRAALLRMHGATVLFGVSGVFGKLVAGSSGLIVFGRSVFALAALSLLCLRRGRAPWRGIGVRDAAALMLTGLLLALHWWTFFTGVKIGGVAVGTLGFACFPAFVALFEALFFRERLSTVEYVLIAFVSLGLVLVTPSFAFGDRATEGLLWGVLSGGIYALNAIANRFSVAHVSGVQACWWQYAFIVTVSWPFVLAELPGVSPLDWVWIACLGLLCTGLAYTLFITSLRALKARMAAIIIALEPVYAIFAAWLLFGDVPGPRVCAGGALIIGTVIWAGLRRS